MVRLREIPRTAAFAWWHGIKPLLITGTRAGAVDADFSDETKLELWDFNLDSQEQGLELQPVITLRTDLRFYDIAWSPPIQDYKDGIIAGAMENGSLDLWDAAKLIDGQEDAFISRSTKHTGAIKSLEFNFLRPQILATGGAKGEVFVWDVKDISTPFRLGAAGVHDIDCVAWNRKVGHILATGGSNGFVTVWDLKTKKASLTLPNNRKPVSAIAWDPTNSTKLLTATHEDSTPAIYLWDLKNSNAPERTLEGHEQGVLSLSWCQQDVSLMISCGKDNRTLIWNPRSGEKYGEFPEVTNWTFLTSFNPRHPFLSATASFDGKITVQTLQNTNPTAAPASQLNLNDEDFFTKAQTQPQGASFSLPMAPAWYLRPVGVSFGYGGKVVVVKKNKAAAGEPRRSTVEITTVTADPDIGSASEKFEEAIKKGDIAGICESRLESAKTDEERSEWQVLKTLNDPNDRTKIIEYLGFSKDQVLNGEEANSGSPTQEDGAHDTLAPQATGEKKDKSVISMWEEGEGDDDFLKDLVTSQGAQMQDPFRLLSGENSALEDQVTKALMLGDFEKAAEICIRDDRMADALMVANCGGKELLEEVQTRYLGQKKGSPSYLRLLSSVVNKNLSDLVYNADLSNWKETMVTLCTFADPSEFPELCKGLGDRIYESGSRKDASFCYLVGSKLEKVINIWVAELQEAEQAGMKESAGGDSTFSVHARSLQQFIEKVTVFRHVTMFEDAEKELADGWKLASLYEKYTEYADIVASQGLLGVAQMYLDLLPTKYPAAEVARNRVRLAMQSNTTAPSAPQLSPARQALSRPSTTAYSSSAVVAPAVPVANPYVRPSQPPALTPTPNPYSIQGQPQFQPPAPGQYVPRGVASQPLLYGQGPALGPYPELPRSTGPPPAAVPPPTRPKDAGSWNDVPMVVKQPTRRNTSSVAPILTPFPGQQQPISNPPSTGPYQRSAPTPPPPPPKGSAPPRNMTSPLVAPPHAAQSIARPSSTVSPSYAPPPAAGRPAVASQGLPGTSLPYAPPQPAAPPSNRYAPVAAPQYNQPPPAASQMGPPPAGLSRPPPSNPYAPLSQQAPVANPYAPPAPSQDASRAPVGPPPSAGIPPGGPPRAASRFAAPAPPPRTASATPPKTRHPSGDRSHIPESAKGMVQFLAQEMQRVASKAPASFATQVKDTDKRLNLLFDDLNNQDKVKPDTVEQLAQLAQAIQAKRYDAAAKIQVDIQTNKTEECGNWMVGVKRLISMSKATP